MRFLFLLTYVLFSATVSAQNNYEEKEIIYGRKDGLALTMVKSTPLQNKNGKAIVYVVSGTWRSSYAGRPAARLKPFMDNGYTVFEVIHGSQPKYTVAEALTDVQRAIRFIKYHSKEYGIDPDKIGISGASAGGHLSLLIGLMDGEGNASSKDPINKLSARVKAVAVFYPPTDFLQWGTMKDAFLSPGLLKMSNIASAFDFKVWDSTAANYASIKDTAIMRAQIKNISPIYHVTSDDPPVFIYHGDKDKVVPLQQSESLVGRLKAVKVPVELKIKEGADHGWPNQFAELTLFIEWFDKYLK